MIVSFTTAPGATALPIGIYSEVKICDTWQAIFLFARWIPPRNAALMVQAFERAQVFLTNFEREGSIPAPIPGFRGWRAKWAAAESRQEFNDLPLAAKKMKAPCIFRLHT